MSPAPLDARGPRCLAALLAICFLTAIHNPAAGEGVKAAAPQVVRCAVVGGLNEIDFWPQLADRFQMGNGPRAVDRKGKCDDRPLLFPVTVTL